MHEYDTKVAKYEEDDPLAVDYKIRSLGNDDNNEDDSDRELFVVDEVVADNILDELITEANKEDTNIFVATTNEVSSKSVPQSASTSSTADIQALIAKALWEKENIHRVKIPNVQTLGAMRRFKKIQITKAPRSNPLGHLPRRMDFLAAHVHNFAKNLPAQVIARIDSAVSTVPKIALTNAFRQTLHRINRRLRNAIKDEMPAVLQTSVLKSMYKEFNALNKLET
ncbi:hypothetical protein Tco_0459773 [Tanacetum coccineum]